MLCVELLPHNTWVPPLLLRRRRSLVLQPALLPPPWLLAIYTYVLRPLFCLFRRRTNDADWIPEERGRRGGEAHNEMRVPLTFLPLPVCLPPLPCCVRTNTGYVFARLVPPRGKREGEEGMPSMFLISSPLRPPPPPPDMSACDAKKKISPNFLSGIYFSLSHLGSPLS